MFKTRDSYNTDHVSQILACAALQAQDHAQANWEKIRNSRSDLITALNELGLVTGASQTNFVLVQVPANHSAINISQALKDQNILVRHFRQPRLEDKLRISIGTEKENRALLSALRGLLQGWFNTSPASDHTLSRLETRIGSMHEDRRNHGIKITLKVEIYQD